MHLLFLFFFFHATATTEIYTLSLHDALPISYLAAIDDGALADRLDGAIGGAQADRRRRGTRRRAVDVQIDRSEEHTSELQSHVNLVCRLLLEKKKKKTERSNDGTTAFIAKSA